MAAHEQDKGAADVMGEQRHGDGGDQSPDDEGVPLPLPDVVKEAEGMVAEVLDLLAREREAAGVEDVDAELDKGDEEQQVKRGDDMGADLRGDLVEAEDPGEDDDEQRGEADGWIDADDHAEGEAPRNAARADAATHLTQERPQDVAAAKLADGFG